MQSGRPSCSPERARFSKRISIEQVEEGQLLAPKFDRDGLIPVVATDADTGEVLMVATMDAEAFLRTVDTREAHYWSRSRQVRWRKGTSSGLVQDVVEIRIDDDQDAVWLRVRVREAGASCHVGYRSCFYRSVKLDQSRPGSPIELRFEETEKKFDPRQVYGNAPNPTRL
ncbi:MAG: phosphoribosyl-AMP cyclohydrolase [Enhydrobacter sp.]|nr:phosphoribosyl-AMP cyclohydrolase [Enhydrobacter sp.]